MPVEPTEEEARRWLVEELSRPEYAEARPTLPDRIWDWLAGLVDIDSVPSAGDGLAVALVALLVVGVLAVVLRVVGPARRAQRRAAGAVFDDESISADEHRRRADRSAAAGQWEEAVRERFRALVRGLEERAVLDERPGRTADEASAEAGVALPALAGALARAARAFDDVCYGGRAADTDQHRTLHELERQVARTKPVGQTAQGGPLLVAPR